MVRRAIPSVFSPKSTFVPEGPSGHAVQPSLDGLAFLTMPDEPFPAVSPGLELASETGGLKIDSDNHSRLVLLIDDDEVVVHLLERALQSENYRSLSVGAGRGLDLMVLEERPFAIVVDITVPEVDGFEIVPRLRQHPLVQGVPIVMMSTRSGLKDRRSSRGLQNFLTKPFRPSQLLQMLRKFAKDTEQT